MLYTPNNHYVVKKKLADAGLPQMFWDVSDSGVQSCMWQI
jgi:hypothetical protein